VFTIPERNEQILQMRKEGVRRKEVARRFKLSPTRIYLVEKRDAVDRATAKRRVQLREAIRSADDPDELWPVKDLLDAIGLSRVTKKSLMCHFRGVGRAKIPLRGLMDMCLDAPVEGCDFMMPSLLRIRGVGKKGFWSVANGLTSMDLGSRCNGDWQKRLATMKQQWGVIGATPYFSTTP
jgi:hypothetical protein